MTTDPQTAAAVIKARHEGAIEALRSAAEHMSVGAAIGPVPIEVRPVVEAWLCRLAEQRLGRAKKEAAGRLHEALATPPTASVPSAPVDRAAVLREAADRLDAAPPPTDHPDRFLSGVRWATSALRRIARETQQAAVSGPGAADDKQDGAQS